MKKMNQITTISQTNKNRGCDIAASFLLEKAHQPGAGRRLRFAVERHRTDRFRREQAPPNIKHYRKFVRKYYIY